MTATKWREEIAKLNENSSDNYSKSSLDFVYSNRSIRTGVPVIDFMYYGVLKDNSTKGSDITEYLKKLGFELQSSFYEQKKSKYETKNFADQRFSACYISKKGYIKIERRVEYDSQHSVYFDITAEKDFILETNLIENFIDEFLVRKDKPEKQDNKQAYALKAGPNGYDVVPLGKIGRKFIPENYCEEVREGFTKLLDNIQAENPFGRLSILTGVPGTGKTFFIKALIEEFSKVKFIMVDPHIMTNISGPALIDTFLQLAGENMPVVLCIEDADSCLVERMQDNMSYISSLLNLTDGIYGESLNIHVIASTNQNKIEIDPALARPGRLHNLIEFKKLSREQAESIYKRETGKDINFENNDANISNKKVTKSKSSFGFSQAETETGFTVAEVYNKLYKAGKSKKKIEVLESETKEYTLEELLF